MLLLYNPFVEMATHTYKLLSLEYYLYKTRKTATLTNSGLIMFLSY